MAQGTRSTIGAADWLSFAATPTFAAMALAAQVQGAPAVFCGASAMTGMVPMYVLMSVFHAAPWLKLIAKQCDRLRNL